jgi:hypothetical protein
MARFASCSFLPAPFRWWIPRHLNAHDDLTWQMLAGGDASRAEWFEKLKTLSGVTG